MPETIYKPKKLGTNPNYYGVISILIKTGWSRAKLYRKMQMGDFPLPEIRGVTKQKIYWKTSTIKALGL